MRKILTYLLILLSTMALSSCKQESYYLDYTDQIDSIDNIEILEEVCDENINCEINVLSIFSEEDDILELLSDLSELEYKTFLFGDPITDFDVYGIRINYSNETYRIIDEMCNVLHNSNQSRLEIVNGYTTDDDFLELINNYIE